MGCKERPAALATQLAVANLLPEQMPDYSEIEGTWTPPALLKNIVAQRVRPF